MDQRRWALVLLLGGAALFGARWILPRVGKSSADPRIGQPFPSLSLFDGQARPLPFEDLIKKSVDSGSRRILVSLWATWCDPCVAELPEIEKRRDDWRKNGLDVLLVNYDGGSPKSAAAEVNVWEKKLKLDIATHFDPGEKILGALSVSALPFSVLLDAQAKILWLKSGMIDFENDAKVFFQDL